MIILYKAMTDFNQPLPQDYILRLQGKDEWDEMEEE
jgi:hypothetical protein